MVHQTLVKELQMQHTSSAMHEHQSCNVSLHAVCVPVSGGSRRPLLTEQTPGVIYQSGQDAGQQACHAPDYNMPTAAGPGGITAHACGCTGTPARAALSSHRSLLIFSSYAWLPGLHSLVAPMKPCAPSTLQAQAGRQAARDGREEQRQQLLTVKQAAP